MDVSFPFSPEEIFQFAECSFGNGGDAVVVLIGSPKSRNSIH